MNDSRSPHTGIIENKKNNVVFFGDKYLFTFMTSSLDSIDGCEEVNVSSKDGFVYGKTHDSKDIAIYVGNSLRFFDKYIITTYMYVIQKYNNEDMSKYTSIRFIGGVLNYLFSPDALKFSLDSNKLEYKDDSKIFSIRKNGVEKIVLGSYVNQSALEIKNKDVYMEIFFENEQCLHDFMSSYKKVLDIMSIMTNRRNVGFEKIILIKKNRNSPLGYDETADVFFRLDEDITKKDGFRFIPFSTLEGSFANLVNLVFDKDSEKLIPELSIIPQNDKRPLHVTNDLIRSVCSSLELEISFTDLPSVDEEKQKIDNLVFKIKSMIKDHRKTDERLSEDTYSLINGSMKNWSVTLANKIEALYQKFKPIIQIVCNNYLNDELISIKEFVKYRNSISHGTALSPSRIIVHTTIALRILVFCSFFDRLGLSNDKINDIMLNGYWL